MTNPIKHKCEHQEGRVRNCNNPVTIYIDDETGRRHYFCKEHSEDAERLAKKLGITDWPQEL